MNVRPSLDAGLRAQRGAQDSVCAQEESVSSESKAISCPCIEHADVHTNTLMHANTDKDNMSAHF